MKKLAFILFVFCFAVQSWGQESQEKNVYKERESVNFTIYDFLYNRVEKDSARTNIIYNSSGDIISYQYKKKEKKSQKLTGAKLDSMELKSASIKANLIAVDNKIMIYPWIFTDESDASKKRNSFFKENQVYIKMEDRKNYSFCYKSFNLSVITLPIKWYLSSDLGNVETSLNAMLMGGIKFGKSRFVKFPHEEEARSYKSLWSVNALAGLSKIDIKASNRKEGSSVEGSVAAFSTGLSIGKHYRDFSFLLASGFDIPTSNSKDWKFSGIPWLGIGFGYNLF